MTERKIQTQNAPKALGPYSQAIETEGKMLFVSGQIPLTSSGEFVGDSIQVQTKQCMENIKAILVESGYDFSHVVKVGIFLTDLANFDEVNAIYATYFEENPPARVCYEVAGLPKGVSIEIDAIAVK